MRAQGGWNALYKGLGATLMLDLPFALIQFPLFESIKAQLARRRLADDPAASAAPTPTEGAAAGAGAGACAAALTTPLDVLVTHAATVQPGEAEGGEYVARHPLQIGATLVREEGMGSLMRGVGPRTIYYAWVCGCFFGMYETFRRVLEAHGL